MAAISQAIYIQMRFREWKVLYFDSNFKGPIDNNPALV